MMYGSEKSPPKGEVTGERQTMSEDYTSDMGRVSLYDISALGDEEMQMQPQTQTQYPQSSAYVQGNGDALFSSETGQSIQRGFKNLLSSLWSTQEVLLEANQDLDDILLTHEHMEETIDQTRGHVERTGEAIDQSEANLRSKIMICTVVGWAAFVILGALWYVIDEEDSSVRRLSEAPLEFDSSLDSFSM